MNMKNSSKQILVKNAVAFGQLDVLKILLNAAATASVNIKNCNGKIPLHL